MDKPTKNRKAIVAETVRYEVELPSHVDEENKDEWEDWFCNLDEIDKKFVSVSDRSIELKKDD